MTTIEASAHPVILFDGVCNLCSSSVQFVIRHDPRRTFRFASLQSDFAREILEKHGLSLANFDTIILYKNDQVYYRSTAALLIARHLNGGWKALSLLLVVPRSIRDGVYNFISNHRYKWFGKKNACWIPSTALKSLFIS